LVAFSRGGKLGRSGGFVKSTVAPQSGKTMARWPSMIVRSWT
jgi:hypothetical protein